MRNFLFGFLIVSGATFCPGQTTVQFYRDTLPVQKTVVADTSELVQAVQNQLIQAWDEGFMFAGVDSVRRVRNLTEVFLHRGEKVTMVIDCVFLSGSDFYEKQVRGTRRAGQVRSYIRDILKAWNDTGYPFARLEWDTVFSRHEKLHAVLNIIPGPFVANDSMKFISEIKTDEAYIYRSLDLIPGRPFSERSYRAIEKRIERIPFLELRSPPDIGFSGGKATVHLDLKEHSMNAFEGVVGLLPGPEGDQRLLVTGFLDLKLNNLFRSGKALSFTWQSYARQSQELTLRYRHPYLLDTRLLFNVGFDLLKQDTTFVNRNLELGVGHYLADNIRFGAVYNRASGDLLAGDVSEASLRGLADYTTNLYALEVVSGTFSSDFGFRSGFDFYSRLSIGGREIRKNPSIPAEYYDTIALSTDIFKLELATKAQRTLPARLAVSHACRLGWVANEQILTNELFRLGGLHTLRGFNEKFFYAQFYALSRLELRQYFENRSYFMLFYDQMYMNNENGHTWPLGLGTGFSLATTNGLFNFAMALGQSEELPFDVSAIKVHLGYISRF